MWHSISSYFINTFCFSVQPLDSVHVQQRFVCATVLCLRPWRWLWWWQWRVVTSLPTRSVSDILCGIHSINPRSQLIERSNVVRIKAATNFTVFLKLPNCRSLKHLKTALILHIFRLKHAAIETLNYRFMQILVELTVVHDIRTSLKSKSASTLNGAIFTWNHSFFQRNCEENDQWAAKQYFVTRLAWCSWSNLITRRICVAS